MTNHEIVKKIVGKINPIAESNTDTERFENLKEMCHLVEMLLIDIEDLRADKSNAYSVKRATDYATNFLHKTVRDLATPAASDAVIAKAAKWDALDEKISSFYHDDDSDDEGGNLVDIGEAAARAFGYM